MTRKPGSDRGFQPGGHCAKGPAGQQPDQGRLHAKAETAGWYGAAQDNPRHRTLIAGARRVKTSSHVAKAAHGIRLSTNHSATDSCSSRYPLKPQGIARIGEWRWWEPCASQRQLSSDGGRRLEAWRFNQSDGPRMGSPIPEHGLEVRRSRGAMRRRSCRMVLDTPIGLEDVAVDAGHNPTRGGRCHPTSSLPFTPDAAKSSAGGTVSRAARQTDTSE